MKTKAVIAILLMSMFMVQDAESFWFRFKLRPSRRPVCSFTCPRVCSTWVLRGGMLSCVCRFACRYRCGKKKREATENNHVTPLSRDLDFYDLNDDEYVTIMELSQTLGHTVPENDLLTAFNQTDSNQDAKLSEEEFFGPNSYFVFSEPESTPTGT